jgi:hypothetical protein
MSGSSGVLWRILRSGSPVAVVFYPESTTREAQLEEVELLAPPERKVIRAREVEAAFRDPEAIVLLTPDDEARAVEVLDLRREALRDRSAPAVLFLLADGGGERRLREAYALASWLRGREYDPTRAGGVDVSSAREAFRVRTGHMPEAWLDAWRRGALADTLDNNLLAQEALLLEGSA